MMENNKISELSENIESTESSLTSEISEKSIFDQINEGEYKPIGSPNFAFTDNPGNSIPPGGPDSPNSPAMQAEGNNNLGEFIDGEFFIDTSDFLISSLILLVAQLIGYEFSRSDFELTEKEKKTLYKPAAMWLKSVNINLNNPLYNLLFAVGMIYAGKFMKAIPKAKKLSKKKAIKQPAPADDQPDNNDQESEADKHEKKRQADEILKRKYVIKNDVISKYPPDDQATIRAYITKYKASKKNAIEKLTEMGAITKIVD